MDRYKLVFTEEQLNFLLVCLDGQLRRDGLNSLNAVVDLYNVTLNKQVVEGKKDGEEEKEKEAQRKEKMGK